MNEHKLSLIIQNQNQELEGVKKDFEDAKATIRFLLREKADEITLIKKKFSEDLKNGIIPSLIALKQSSLNQTQINYIESIESTLSNLTEPFWEMVNSKQAKLSPVEIRVASFVRNGKTNKEIAKALNLSKSTILTHRHHIRKKLGLHRTKSNLHSYLNFG
jgi:DNA-binding NarL/FixJ family response regulator